MARAGAGLPGQVHSDGRPLFTRAQEGPLPGPHCHSARPFLLRRFVLLQSYCVVQVLVVLTVMITEVILDDEDGDEDDDDDEEEEEADDDGNGEG